MGIIRLAKLLGDSYTSCHTKSHPHPGFPTSGTSACATGKFCCPVSELPSRRHSAFAPSVLQRSSELLGVEQFCSSVLLRPLTVTQRMGRGCFNEIPHLAPCRDSSGGAAGSGRPWLPLSGHKYFPLVSEVEEHFRLP